MTLDSPVTAISGVGPRLIPKLARLGIQTVTDLLTYLPRQYQDWTAPVSIRTVEFGQTIVIAGQIVWARNERSVRRRMALTKALIRTPTGDISATWFNQPFLLHQLAVGQTRYFRGSVGFDRAERLKILLNPQIAPKGEIIPVYAATAGLSSAMIRRLVQSVLPNLPLLPELLPISVLREHELLGRQQAIRILHQPSSPAAIAAAQRRIAFEELYTFFLQLAQLRQRLEKERAPAFDTTNVELQTFAASLPFKLTDDQRRAAWQIIRDLRRPVAMNRLLEGDVGTGKTAVAAFAAFVAARSGYQTVVLAPTTVLADQHVQSLTTFLGPHGVSVGQWTGQIKTLADRQPPAVLVGTHALLHGRPPLGKVGLVVVDEQHRFGVEQRAALRAQQADGTMPHFLSMTATPIPRTLALALYGDLVISRLEEHPAQRSAVTTRLIEQPTERDQAYARIRTEVVAGRQAFVVCPTITDGTVGETLFADPEPKNVQAEFDRLRRRVFPDLRVGLLHGQLAPPAKQRVMDAFRLGQLDLLVTTAVIEVGVDVPNATVMLIEGADRFGLSQLHQLRGRVGRGKYPGMCFLFPSLATSDALARLRCVEEETSGFALAEIDLRRRGPGEFIGEHQTGFPPFRYANLFDFDLLARARKTAEAMARHPLPTVLSQRVVVPLSHAE